MGVWLSGENGQDTHLCDFAMIYFQPRTYFQRFACIGVENTVISHMQTKMAKCPFAQVYGCGPNFARKCGFRYVGLVV